VQTPSPTPSESGSIEVITGPMFSGKTEELIRRLHLARAGNTTVQAFKPAMDDRYGGTGHIVSHSGLRFEAIPVRTSIDLGIRLISTADIVAIDEAQFLDEGTIGVVTRAADRGCRVILAGLETDFRGLPFGPMPHFLAAATSVSRLPVPCARCGSIASRTQRLMNGAPAPFDAPTLLVGGGESYEPRCIPCHEVPAAPAGPTGGAPAPR